MRWICISKWEGGREGLFVYLSVGESISWLGVLKKGRMD